MDMRVDEGDFSIGISDSFIGAAWDQLGKETNAPV
jgi:hypothetical protein